MVKMYNTRRPIIYVGYDPKEHIAFEILKDSINQYTSKYDVIPLEQSSLRRSGLYKRTYYLDEEGQMRDFSDRKPFSSEFTFTRFLIPFINLHKGLALFMDSDMFVRADITEVFEEYGQFDEYAVSVVKHDYKPKEVFKMDSQLQTNYSRKNWSSFVLWNCEHPANERLTIEDVNTKSGRWLHNFKWLEDNEIGAIHPKWNFLDGWTDVNINPCNVHFTTGGPWFKDWTPKRPVDANYSGEWKTSKKSYQSRILPKEK
jgi:lipopolysaccharide biosynthesis glycosyltransferase